MSLLWVPKEHVALTSAVLEGTWFDMSLLWVPKEHVALTSAVLESTLTECGPINGVLCTDNSSEFDDLHGQLLSTSTPHLRREPESESISSIVRGPIFCLQVRLL